MFSHLLLNDNSFPEKMKESYLGFSALLICFLSFTLIVQGECFLDALPMRALRTSLGNPRCLRWSDPDPCNWNYIKCSENRVMRIQISNLNLEGTLPPELTYLESLVVLEVANNQLTGPIPTLSGLSSLRQVLFNNNNFSSIPSDFFEGLTSLQSISLDFNPLSSWEIPESLKDATSLQNFSAIEANISGTIPDFLGGFTFPRLTHLHLDMNNLEGQIRSSFASPSIQTLSLKNQRSAFKLNGSLAVLQNMTSLTKLCLDNNHFSGPLPDFSGLTNLVYLSLRDNRLTGIVPLSLVNIPRLATVILANNFLQGPTPKFDYSKHLDIETRFNSFCVDDPDVPCDSRVNILLSIAESVGYPLVFAKSWTGNDPCNSSQEWKGITCDDKGNILVINFNILGLSGAITSNFSMLTSLTKLILSNNSLTGTIPNELTALSSLVMLDVSNNSLHGEVPEFRQNVIVNTDGNPDIRNDRNRFTSPGSKAYGRRKNSNIRKIVNAVIGAVVALFIIFIGLGVCLYTRKQKQSKCWKLLRNVTNNFSEKNILGRGGSGTVYKGELQDGTKIAVKRMKSGEVSEQGFEEFKSEIEVLTKVRHRHLVALLGYCLDGNERLLVYEYMPQGTLSRHLFNWKEEGLKPLEWNRRLNIALDVARGLEYLHGLAHQSFIHRDVKPSNILLGNDMRAKVADFGLARHVPEKGRDSIETRLVGTFGYLAPEYVATGRVTTKVDVFSFGVILMELITGKKAIDSTLPEDMVYLVPWFRRIHTNRRTFPKTIDQTIELDEETLASVSIVAELANHCCTSKPYQRPDMNHVVNVLSSLAELWSPVEPAYNDMYGIQLESDVRKD